MVKKEDVWEILMNSSMGVTIKNGFELDNIPEEHVKLMLKDMH